MKRKEKAKAAIGADLAAANAGHSNSADDGACVGTEALRHYDTQFHASRQMEAAAGWRDMIEDYEEIEDKLDERISLLMQWRELVGRRKAEAARIAEKLEVAA